MSATNALLATSAISQIGGTISQRNAAKAQQAFQQNQFDFNKQIAEFNAQEAIRRGEQQERLVRQQGKKVIGAQRASFAAQGIDIEQGSALDVQLDTAQITEIDALTIKNNAAREAFGFKVQAVADTAQQRFSQIAFDAKQKSTLITGGLGLTNIGLQALGNNTGTKKPTYNSSKPAGSFDYIGNTYSNVPKKVYG